MTINGVEIGEFGASLLTYKASPANIQHAVTTGYNSAFPVLMDTEIGTKTLTLTMHIRGGSLKLVAEKEALLLEALYKQSEIELPDGYFYRCMYQSATVDRIMDTLSELTVTLDAIRHLPLVTVQVAQGEFTVLCQSTIPTECRLSVTPNSAASSCTVYGITITNLTAGTPVVIDGMNKTVTQAGINKFLDTDLLEFPRLQPGINQIPFSGDIQVSASYYPTFL